MSTCCDAPREEGTVYKGGARTLVGWRCPVCGEARYPGEPTQELVGTPGKMQVMTERAARGESLFHPLDNTDSGGHPRSEEPPKAENRRAYTLPVGVRWDKRGGKWRARVWDDAEGKSRSLGLFDTAAEAEDAIASEASSV